ncbi:GNAT family N-acetyltransferase [Sphingobacterium sp.]|uniref:GNAT family N-acetyltransferase n=1 Tax=Sphingobacterium sp. TaxID=341027 RepID=UPI00289A556C|nr:GNAT family N-acetyltransferase [Sphingobacterium sp.]
MLALDFSIFPQLETDRLQLTRTNVDHVNELLKMRSDPEVMKFIPRPMARTAEEIIEFIAAIDEKISNHEMINWAITLKGDAKMIGTIGYYHIKPEHFRAEIGYMLLPEFQGRGFITEAIDVVVSYGFAEMKLHSVEAVLDPNNLASASVLEKCGFTKEGHFKENEFYNGKFIDTAIYSKVNS